MKCPDCNSDKIRYENANDSKCESCGATVLKNALPLTTLRRSRP